MLLAPVWKLTAASNLLLSASRVAPNNFWPLNLVFSKMLFSSLPSSPYSACIAARSASPFVPLAAWVARSFMRCRMLVTSSSALSAVCSRDDASATLRMATSMPRLCASRRVATCRPAASSAAPLMRKPVPRRCWLEVRALLILFRLLEVLIAAGLL
ncbi:hypothetical protein D3C77_488410 [compost metagenome]